MVDMKPVQPLRLADEAERAGRPCEEVAGRPLEIDHLRGAYKCGNCPTILIIGHAEVFGDDFPGDDEAYPQFLRCPSCCRCNETPRRDEATG